MANDPLNPQMGERNFNGSEFDYLRDVEPVDLQGLLTAQPGLEEVLKEVNGHAAEWGEAAGMPPSDITQLELLNQRLARIDVFLEPVAKFAEMLSETRYLLEDERQRILRNLGASVERRGKKVPELYAKFERTRSYRSSAGKKAAKTRKKNAEGAKAPAPEPGTKNGNDG